LKISWNPGVHTGGGTGWPGQAAGVAGWQGQAGGVANGGGVADWAAPDTKIYPPICPPSEFNPARQEIILYLKGQS
jgi:hypothetical protein